MCVFFWLSSSLFLHYYSHSYKQNNYRYAIFHTRSTTQVHRYEGSYEAFLTQRVARLKADDASFDAQKNKLKKEAEWMAKQPKARQAKSKSREAEFEKLNAATRQVREESACVST